MPRLSLRCWRTAGPGSVILLALWTTVVRCQANDAGGAPDPEPRAIRASQVATPLPANRCVSSRACVRGIDGRCREISVRRAVDGSGVGDQP